jgi:methionyl aminopeptidase
MYTRVKSSSEIEAMRTSGKMLATVLGHLKQNAAVGMSTKDLSDMAVVELKKLGGNPVFLGQPGPYPFPDIICISVNDEVVHGIPHKNRILHDGDLLSLDFGVRYNGMITDGAITIVVGTTTKEKDALVTTTEQAMLAGVSVLKDGVRTGTIGAAIEAVLKKQHYGIVRDMVGHGVGHELHEDPNIPNYGKAHTGPQLMAGMTIAIEPMATLGKEHIYLGEDEWTILTRDGSLSAHFEHTVLITDSGAEILTTV